MMLVALLKVSHRVSLLGAAAQWAESMRNGREVTSPLLKTVSIQEEVWVGTGSSAYHALFAVSEDEGEEEAWLDALEAGQVNERGYLPQKKDISTLTARQVHGLTTVCTCTMSWNW